MSEKWESLITTYPGEPMILPELALGADSPDDDDYGDWPWDSCEVF